MLKKLFRRLDRQLDKAQVSEDPSCQDGQQLHQAGLHGQGMQLASDRPPTRIRPGHLGASRRAAPVRELLGRADSGRQPQTGPGSAGGHLEASGGKTSGGKPRSPKPLTGRAVTLRKEREGPGRTRGPSGPTATTRRQEKPRKSGMMTRCSRVQVAGR